MSKEDFNKHRKEQKGKSSYSNMSFKCPECNESVDVLNNDIKLSLQLHVQKHRPSSVQPQSEDQASVSSSTSKNSSKRGNKSNNTPTSTNEQSSVLDNIFGAMPPDLKSHRGFVFENESGDTVCSICNSNIDSFSKIADHLKTKLHEDNIISFIKGKLSNDLQEIMEFVSFYGSNLCCNLCRSKIELCSKNPYKTVVNIMTHNSGNTHSNKKTKTNLANYNDEASKILNSLAALSPSINNSKNLIDCKIQPQFSCKLCDKQIIYSKNEKVTLQNFLSHVGSAGHVKSLESVTVLNAFQATYRSKDKKHNLKVLKGSIYCSSCNFHLESNAERLAQHVEEYSSSKDFDISNLLSKIKLENSTNQTQPNTLDSKTTSASSQPSKAITLDTVLTLPHLLSLIPESIKTIKYIMENKAGEVTCTICKFTASATLNNVIQHITGKNHALREQNLQGRSAENMPVGKNETKLASLLNSLSKPYKYLNYIVETEQGQIRCLICNCTIPDNTFNLETHLGGNNHIKKGLALSNSAEKNNAESPNLPMGLNPFVNNSFIDPTLSVNSEGCQEQTIDGDISINKLKKSDAFINSISKNLTKKNGKYFCKVCAIEIPNGNETTLKINLTTHFLSETHKTFADKDDIFQELFTEDPILEAEKKFVKYGGGNVTCTLCKCSMAIATKKTGVKLNLLSHFKGSCHVKARKNFEEKVFLEKATSSGSNLFNTSVNPPLKSSAAQGKQVDLKESANNKNSSKKDRSQKSSENQEVLETMRSLTSVLSNIDKKLANK